MRNTRQRGGRLLDALRLSICFGEELQRKLAVAEEKKYGVICEFMGDNCDNCDNCDGG